MHVLRYLYDRVLGLVALVELRQEGVAQHLRHLQLLTHHLSHTVLLQLPLLINFANQVLALVVQHRQGTLTPTVQVVQETHLRQIQLGILPQLAL